MDCGYLVHRNGAVSSESRLVGKRRYQDGLFYGLVLISPRPPRCIALEGHPRWDTEVRWEDVRLVSYDPLENVLQSSNRRSASDGMLHVYVRRTSSYWILPKMTWRAWCWTSNKALKDNINKSHTKIQLCIFLAGTAYQIIRQKKTTMVLESDEFSAQW